MERKAGKKISREMYAYKPEICEECDGWIDEDEVFHYVDDAMWCGPCVESLDYED